MTHPLIWFKTDDTGRWPELTNKLILNDLEYKGNRILTDRESALENVRTSHATCIKEGAPPFPCPNAPQTYSEVVAILKKKGLITSIPLPEDSETEDEEVNRHRQQVSKH